MPFKRKATWSQHVGHRSNFALSKFVCSLDRVSLEFSRQRGSILISTLVMMMMMTLRLIDWMRLLTTHFGQILD